MASTSIRIRVINAHDLDADLIGRWHDLRAVSDKFSSPFFTPEFTQLMARYRDDVRIGLIEQDHNIVGILPFHKKGSGVASPIGGHLCDYQAIIGSIPHNLSKQELLKALGIDAIDFNHALAGQLLFSNNAIEFSTSPRVDLRHGFDAWLEEVKRKTSSIKNTQRKSRKLARELGDLEFRYNDSSQEAWDQFLFWKAQSLNLDVATLLSPDWVNGVFTGARDLQGPHLSGVFSTLYAGDRLVAAHFGIQSSNALHWWFPTYDPELGKYSPGLIHLLLSIEHISEMGLDELDFGRGESRYKLAFSNQTRTLCEGSLEQVGTRAGSLRRLRKLGQHAVNHILPERAGSLALRAGNRLLHAGRLD